MTGDEIIRTLRRHVAWPWVVASLLLFGATGAAAFVLPPMIFGAILAVGAVVLAWVVVPEAVIMALLLARSSVDGFMELFTLFAGSPLSMNLAGAVNSLAVGLGVLSAVRRLVRRQPLLAAAPGWAYALFLLVGALSIPQSVDSAASVKEWARLASGMAIYLLVAEVVHDERGARRFIAVIFMSSLVPLSVALIQLLTGGGYFFLGFVGTEFAYRPEGTFSHPAALGSYLIILLTLAVALYFSSSSVKLRVALLAWGSVAAACLVLTLARAQWLGMIVATLVIGLLKKRKLAVLSLLVTVLLLTAIPLLRERLVASESIGWRMQLWQAGLQLAWPPRVLGRGLATSPWHISQILPNMEFPPHNDYLKVQIELGLVGLIAYCAWLVAMIQHAWRAYRRARDRAIAWRGLGLLAILLAGIGMGLVDNYLGYAAVQWYLWALVGLVPRGGHWLLSEQARTRLSVGRLPRPVGEVAHE